MRKFTSMIFQLDKRLLFPDPDLAEPDGLLAVGGDLSVNRLLLAYNNGIFPWYNEPPILWYSPPERFVLYPDELKVTKSMRQVLRSNNFNVTVDQCFEDVITACSLAPREGQDGTWINDDMKTLTSSFTKKIMRIPLKFGSKISWWVVCTAWKLVVCFAVKACSARYPTHQKRH